MSNFEVFPPKCEVLLLDTGQREDVFNQKERKKLSERRPTPKKLTHVRTVPQCTFQDSILLETVVETSGSSSLKELRDDLAIHGDCGEMSTSTISRNIRNKLPGGRNYSRKRLGKYASERFTPENIVYTQLYIGYLKDKDPSFVKFFDESGFQLPGAGQETLISHLSVKIL